MSVGRNSLYNLLGSAAPLVASLVSIPFYLEKIGLERYGVITIVWLLLGYFGVFDMGMGRATAQRLASNKDSPSDSDVQIVCTAIAVNAFLGLIGGVGLVVCVSYFGSLLKIDSFLFRELDKAIFFLFFSIPILTVSAVMNGVMQGKQKFYLLNLVNVFGALFFQLCPLAAAYWISPTLDFLIPAAIFARFLTLLVLLYFGWRFVLKGKKLIFSIPEAKGLIRFGGWVAVTSLISPLMVVFDRFLIANFLGPKFVSYYSVPFQLAERMTIVPVALSNALFPKLASASPEDRYDLGVRGVRTVIAIMTPLTLIALSVVEPFLTLWVGKEFSIQAMKVAPLIIAAFWINSIAVVPYALLQASGKPEVVAKNHLVEIVPYIFFLYVFMGMYGVFGAAIAFFLRVFVDFFLLAHFSGIFRDVMSDLRVPFLMVSVFCLIVMLVPISSLHVTAVGMLFVIFSFFCSWKEVPVSIRKKIITKVGF